MSRSIKKLFVFCLLAALAPAAMAFSLLGPLKGYQTPDIGYGLPGDLGGPMSLTESYRWNVPVITYAFDTSFINYFGTNGMNAVDAAFKILNDLPAAGSMSRDLSEFPTRTVAENFEAGVLGIIDVKSRTLTMLLEQLGLAAPERWVFALRASAVQPIGGVSVTNYTVIKQNYDPVTLLPSSYVNTSLYTYTIEDPIKPSDYADAVEGDPLADDDGVPDMTVASFRRHGFFVTSGLFFRGLTRDDVGGLRYLLNPAHLANEALLDTVTQAVGGPPPGGLGWIAWFGNATNSATNVVIGGAGTNIITTGLRPGINKLTFKKTQYDSLIGQAFTPLTNRYVDQVVGSNGTRLIKQNLQRAITQPDILFVCEDLGLRGDGLTPIPFTSSGIGAWINNSALNGQGSQSGPGVIQGPIRLSFTDQFPYFSNSGATFLTEPSSGSDVWGSYDGSTDAPIIYPAYLNLTLEDLRRLSGK